MNKLAETNAFVTGAHSMCAQTLNTRLQEALVKSKVACAQNPGGCVKTVLTDFDTEYRSAHANCKSDDDRKEFAAVDSSYRNFVTGLTAVEVAGAFDLKNSPRRLLSLGLVTAFAFKRGPVSATRVKLDGGKIVADPLSRQLNIVVINSGFTRYNADAFHPTPAERFQWFAGAAVTPDVGLAGGLSIGIVRGLSVNVGGAILGVRGLRGDDELGAVPKHAEDPFRLSSARLLFCGVGYKFK